MINQANDNLGVEPQFFGNFSRPPKVLSPEIYSIKISKEAIEKIFSLKGGIKSKVLSIAVEGGGCQGFQYKIDFIDLNTRNLSKSKEVLLITENSEPIVLLDSLSEFYVKGSKLAYQVGLVQSGFAIVDNPKVKNSCGCKKSFSTDEFYPSEKLDN